MIVPVTGISLRGLALACFLLSVAGGSATLAQGLGRENCRATAEIVAIAIEQRRKGQLSNAIIARLTTGPDAVEPPYDSTVPTLVEWVFTLNRAQLTPAMAREFEAQCLKY